MTSLRIVCSAENNAYMAWQSKLFAYSCASRLRKKPLVVVHTEHPDTDPVCTDFLALDRLGVPVHMAPQYKNGHPTEILYHPRNTPGSMIFAAELCTEDYLMICDPDLIFRGPFVLPGGDVSAAWYWSMVDYETEEIQDAAAALGVSTKGRTDLHCGVPYLVRRSIAKELGEAWLEAVDLLDPRGSMQMYAFGLAVLKLGLTVGLADVVHFNDVDGRVSDAPILHYGFDADGWTKRRFARPREIREVWNSTTSAPEDTVTAEICRQLREAGAFYRRSLTPA